MPKEVTMPQMGYDMTEGRIAQWLKHEGDKVKKGDAIAEVETDKVTIEIEAYIDGTLARLVAKEGDVVPVGNTIAVITEEGETLPAQAEPQQAAQQQATQPDLQAAQKGDAPAPEVLAQEERPTTMRQIHTEKPVLSTKSKDESLADALAALRARKEGASGQQIQPRRDGERLLATPAARSIARDRGIDLAGVQGSGPDGRIQRADVERAASGGQAKPAQQPAQAPQQQPQAPAQQPQQAAPQPAPQAAPQQPAKQPAGEVRELSRMRRAIARRMTESKQQIPHFYVTSAIKMDALLALRKQINAGLDKEAGVTVTDMIIKAAALALAKFPELNASYTEQGIQLHPSVNMSVAVATDDGLLAPVVRDAGGRSLGAISRDLKALAERSRTGKATMEDLEGGTFTISNLGMFDVESFIAIITPPQAAAIAVSSAKQEPVVENGELAIATIMRATISVDHRVADGATAARYMQEFKSIMENPLRLML